MLITQRPAVHQPTSGELSSSLPYKTGSARRASEEHAHETTLIFIYCYFFYLPHRYPPFFDDNPFGIYQKILAGKLEFPRHLDFYVK